MLPPGDMPFSEQHTGDAPRVRAKPTPGYVPAPDAFPIVITLGVDIVLSTRIFCTRPLRYGCGESCDVSLLRLIHLAWK